MILRNEMAQTSDDETELIFMGTGTSGSVPCIQCLTAAPEEEQCRTCLSTLTAEGKKNIRRNTSAVFRMSSKQGEPRKVTIVVDVGKNFYAAAIEYFRQYKLRKIDAVIISHSHADAMNGLDDLRSWTLGSDRVQDHIDIYLTASTFEQVQRCFPYMVFKKFGTGGGDLPEFKWHIIEDKVPFEIEGTGIHITPFLVHHGHQFANAVSASGFSTPVPDPMLEAAVSNITLRTASKDALVPFFCLGFMIEDQIVYMSDVSLIPEDVWPIIRDPERPVPVCVLDCLHLRRHSSHFALDQSIPIAKKIGAQRTYLTGFSHRISHEEYITITEAVGGKSLEGVELTENERKGLEMIAATETDEKRVWIRPAHDGLRIVLSRKGVIDETYDH